MVLMLRSLDVPARFVTGFLGSEPSALGYHIVRQSNAHAWVEAWIPGRGWQVFDPTPPAGRPTTEPQSLWSLMRQGYDFVVFRWDRYVISYGVNDQARLFEGVSLRLRAWWQSLWGGRDAEREPPRPAMPRLPGPAETATSVDRESSSGRLWLAGSLLLVVAVVAWLAVRQRVRPTGARAYLRLRGELRERGVPVEEAVAPIELRERVRRRFPAAGPAAARLVDLYLRESYGGATLTAEERRELESLLAETRRAMRKAS